MAIAGDVIIKLAADFADFASGMTDATKRLEDFGNSATANGTKVTSFIDQLQRGFKALGIGLLVKEFIDFNEELQHHAAELATTAQAYGLTTDALQAYEYAAISSGQKTEVFTTALGRFNQAIGEAERGSKVQIDTLNQLGVKILDANGAIRPTADILQNVAQQLLKMPEGAQRAAIEMTLFGRAGQQINPVLEQMAQGLTTLQQRAKEAGVVLGSDIVEQMDAAQRQADLTAKKFDVLATTLSAQTYGPAKQWFLSVVNDLLQDTLADLKVMEGYTGFLDKILAILTLEGQKALPSDAKLNPVKVWQDDLDKLNTKIAETGAALERVINDPMKGPGSTPAKQLNDELVAAVRNAELLRQKITDFNTPKQTLPTVTTTGTRNPAVAGAGQSTEDAIKRLEAEAAAANKAYDTMAAGFNQPLETISRAVALQKQIDDTVAKLGTKADAAGYVKALSEAATAADTARARLALLDADEKAADATQRRLGDGTAAYNKVVDDLDRQLATHRLQTDAYTRALKEQTEQTDSAALAARRYDDNIGSLTAGFENAARSFSRSNDLYTIGQQTFTGLTTAMTQGLDALSGKSSTTFAQIAGDFATMLEQMAIKALASQVFTLLFTGSSAGSWSSLPPGTFGPPPPNSGGLFGSLFGSIFGGAHATGGPVYPGSSYLVGEQGPERFVPTVAGAIQPMSASSGGVTVNVDMGQQQGAQNPSAALEFGRRVRAAVVDVIAQEKRPGGTLYARHNA